MTVEARGFVLRRNWIPAALCGALVVLGVLLTQLFAMPANIFGYLGIWFGAVFGPVLLLRNAFPRALPTTIRATAAHIEIEGEEPIASEDILEAKVTPRAGDSVVELALRARKVIALRMMPAEAKALVQTLGARRSRFRLVVPFGRRYLATLVLFATGFLVLLRDLEAWLVTLPGCIFYALLFGWLVGYLRGRLVVGADGFTRRWLFWERFIAFRDVATVTGKQRLTDRGAIDTIVALKSGRNVRFRTVEAPNTEEERGAESRAMYLHVKESFERSLTLVDANVDVPTLVQRGSRSAREWLSGLDALVRGGGSRYRIAAVSADMLSDLTNDPGAPVESRIGAAAALVRMDDDLLRTRVRVAAEGCADTELRETLLALSEARDDVAAEAALATLRR